MEDTDLMLFGKHKGKEMANVPANYLIWLHDNASNTGRREYPQIFEYIKDNMPSLEVELINDNN